MKKIMVCLLILLVTCSTMGLLDVASANPFSAYNISRIYIRADGSVEPVNSPITRVGDIYYLTGNITADSTAKTSYNIVIEKDDIILDGANYSFGVGEYGIVVSNRHNITIQDIKFYSFREAILATFSYNITIGSNEISHSIYGVDLQKCNNTVIANNIFHDDLDQATIELWYSNNVIIYGNQLTNGYGIGLGLEFSSNNYIIANSIVHHYVCVMLVNSSGNHFSYNNLIPDNESVRDYRDNHSETDLLGQTSVYYSLNTWSSNYWSNSFSGSSYRINQYNVDNSPLSQPANIDQVPPLDTANPSNMLLVQNQQMNDNKLFIEIAIVILAVIIPLLLVLFYRRGKAKESSK